MKKTKKIPNRPGLFVAMTYERQSYNPFSKKMVWHSRQWVGVSGREISAEASDEEAEKYPVIWRFLVGHPSGGDDPVKEPCWREIRIEVPGKKKDATKSLEESLYGRKHAWYLMEPNYM